MNDSVRHICSLVVQFVPQYMTEMTEQLRLVPDVEVAATDKMRGRAVVVIDVESTPKIKRRISEIEKLDPVISVALVYHHEERSCELDEDVA